MAKKKAGRPKVNDKVKVKYVYLTDSQEKKIIRKFNSLTKAVKERVLPECA